MSTIPKILKATDSFVKELVDRLGQRDYSPDELAKFREIQGRFFFNVDQRTRFQAALAQAESRLPLREITPLADPLENPLPGAASLIVGQYVLHYFFPNRIAFPPVIPLATHFGATILKGAYRCVYGCPHGAKVDGILPKLTQIEPWNDFLSNPKKIAAQENKEMIVETVFRQKEMQKTVSFSLLPNGRGGYEYKVDGQQVSILNYLRTELNGFDPEQPVKYSRRYFAR